MSDLGRLVTELQVRGVVDPALPGNRGRRGGAGPSDHRALTLEGTTVMVPVYTNAAQASPYRLTAAVDGAVAVADQGHRTVATGDVPGEPAFYGLHTAEGIPYRSIALLHGRDVLATTLQQTCIRFRDRSEACQFCAIEQSLADGRTTVRKTPEQVAEVAEAAVRLDGVKQLVMTTGTPNSEDRGARLMAETAAAVKRRVALPIQAQCEPPADPIWYQRMRDACAMPVSTASACTWRWWSPRCAVASCRANPRSASRSTTTPSPTRWPCSGGGRCPPICWRGWAIPPPR